MYEYLNDAVIFVKELQETCMKKGWGGVIALNLAVIENRDDLHEAAAANMDVSDRALSLKVKEGFLNVN